MAARPRGHELTVLLNAGVGESIEYLRGQFDGLLPQSHIVTWDALVPTAYSDLSNTFRRRASEVLRREALRRLKPDVVHIASLFDGFGDDVVSAIPAAPESYLNAVTLYDLIPLAHQETYLAAANVRGFYMEKIEHLQHADLLLGISSFSCDEAKDLLNIPSERLVDISGAADVMFKPLEHVERFRQELMSRYGLERPFIMYAGGFDSRKNIGSLIRAYALLPDTVRCKHQLAIIGGAPEPERDALMALMADVGVTAAEVVFTGYVSDTDLVKLYNLCALYVFPSLQEGFGLPALEAMSSGAIVIGSNTSSLPEVIGHEDALFDPRDPVAIKDKIVAVLTDSRLRDLLQKHGREQPLKFSWQESATRAISAFEDARARSKHQPERMVSTQIQAQEARGLTAFMPAPRDSKTEERGIAGAVIFADDDCGGVKSQHQLSAFEAERKRYNRVVIEIADHAYCAKTLPFAVSGAVDFLLRGNRFGKLLSTLAMNPSGRELVISLVYQSGGYPAISAAMASGFAEEVLSRIFIPSDMQSLGCAQVVEHTDVVEDLRIHGQWRNDAQAVVAEIASLEKPAEVSEEDWRCVATAIARNSAVPKTRASQWLVDISNLFVRDAGTGIQRVVRHVLDELIKSAPEGYRVEAVYLGNDGVFRHARSYCALRYFAGATLPADDPVEFASGDVYLGLDLVAHLVPAHIDRFRDLRNRGVQQHFVVYDMLPILRPDCFDPPSLPLFRSWYEAVAEVADSVMCISRAVANEFRVWLDQARPTRQRPLNIGYFHLGADLGSLHENSGVAGSHEAHLTSLGDRPTLLMVGTIEPRKGHAQVLAAFEQLWQQGSEINLLLVGRPGWMVDDLLLYMRKHPERGHRFFWHEEASDDLLLAAYARASALLMASEGEGFGLPLIEAAHYGLPLIVRDLPVFREVAEHHAYYFSGFDSESLAASLEEWFRLHRQGLAPSSGEMRWATWQESSKELTDSVLQRRWVHTWEPGHEWRHAAYDYRFQTDVGRLVRGRMESSNRAGLLLYGLPLKLQLGRYLVRLMGGWDGASGSAKVEIYVDGGSNMLAQYDFGPGHEPTHGCVIEIELALDGDVDDLEVRVEVDASATLWISELELCPATRVSSPKATEMVERLRG